jgi:hypothetical protein
MFIGVRIKLIIIYVFKFILYNGLINSIIVLIIKLIAPIIICVLTILLFTIETIDFYILKAESENNIDDFNYIYCEATANGTAIKQEFFNSGNSGVYMFLNRILLALIKI